MIIPVVLAGGVGSRLWPVSRQLYPKQFTSVTSNNTLFQSTLTRLDGVVGLGAPVVVCHEEHRFLTAQQLADLGVQGGRILLEPVGRNTAPAVAVAALQSNPDDVLLVLPADHEIRNPAALRRAVEEGATLAATGHLVTFGIVPTSPETGYGYIQQGPSVGVSGGTARAIQRFVEKPDLETVRRYLEAGEYYWNSGMFMFTARRFLEELEKYAPDILEACRTASAGITQDVDFLRLSREAFERCRSDSIDYAVMEQTRDGVVLPLDASWSDLGAWNALWESSEKDSARNVCNGDVLCVDVADSYIHSHSRLVAAVGVDNTVIVETADAVLVAARDRVQDVKSIVQQLEKAGRSESVSHVLVYRPWGTYRSLASGPGFQVKHICVKPGAALSLQMHHHRAEHWVVVCGTATVTCDNRVFTLEENESTFIPLGSKHRLQNSTQSEMELIEVQTGSYLGEDDIVRFDDVYGRAPAEQATVK